MHPSAFAWTIGTLTESDVAGQVVLEAGGMNVNGTVRPNIEYLNPASYTATDMRPGAGVDVVLDAADLAQLGPAGVVVCNEMLEHAEDWQAAIRGMVGALAEGGVIVITTRSAGFPVHGYPDDHWRYPVESMRAILEDAGLVVTECVPDPDPMSPGVFARAVKPAGWVWPAHTAEAWDLIPVGRP